MGNGGAVTRPVPGSSHAEELAEGGDFSRHTEPSDLRDMNTDEIDQSFGDQWYVLLLGIKKLAHRDRNARLLTDQAELVFFLRREWILQEEQVVFLKLFAKIDRLTGCDPLVDVVKQLNLAAQS